MSVDLSIHKRKADDSFPQPPPKRLKRADRDFITAIGQHLGPLDLLRFESVSKAMRANAEGAWMVLQESYPKWGMCEGKEDKYKWSVCLTVNLVRILKEINEYSWPNFQIAQSIHQTQQGLIQRFPIYGSFLQTEFLKYAGLYPTMITDDLKQRRIQLCQLSFEGWGGELLLQTIFAVREAELIPKSETYKKKKQAELIQNYGELAIEKNAICVSYWVCNLLQREDSCVYDSAIEFLAFKTANKKNFEALEEILSAEWGATDSTEELLAKFNKMPSYPPVLMYRAMVIEELEKEDIKKLDARYEQVLQAYGSQIPKNHLGKICEFREKNKQALLSNTSNTGDTSLAQSKKE